jgi:hypothetical protein
MPTVDVRRFRISDVFNTGSERQAHHIVTWSAFAQFIVCQMGIVYNMWMD